MFGSIQVLVSFSSIWCVRVITRRRIMVWPGSCQGKCAWKRSRGAVMEGFVVEKIINASFLFCGEEKLWE